MNLFLSVLCGDLKGRFKSVSTYIYFLLFLVVSALLQLSAAGVFENISINFGGSSRVFINSPLALQQITLITSFFSVFMIAPIFGQNSFKDHLFGFDEIANSKNFSRTAYFFARYVSAFLVSLFILTSIGLGLAVASSFPSIEPAYIGESPVWAYLYPYVFCVIPNLLALGAVFYFMGAYFKKMAYVYLSGAVVFMGWMLSGQFGRDVETYMVGALIDPSGIRATSLVVKYWTAAQQNEIFVPLESYFLYNRLLWMAVGALALLAARVFFERQPSKSAKAKKRVEKTSLREFKTYSQISFVEQSKTGPKEFMSLVWHEFTQSLKHPVILTLLFLGCGYMFLLSPQIGKIMGTPVLPKTYAVVEMLGGVFSLFVLIILTFWSGEMLWKEKTSHMDEIVDSSPSSIMVLRLPKLFALNLLILVLMILVMMTGVIIQTFKGYHSYELSVYFKMLFLDQYPMYFVMSCIAFFIHAFANNKFIGHGGMVVYYVYLIFGSTFGIERKLFIMGSTPSLTYSDMNGFGPNLYGATVMSLTWMALALALTVLSLTFFQRGKESSLTKRFLEGFKNLGTKNKVLGFFSFLSFVCLWSFSYYNISVLNEFEFKKEVTAKQVEYEKTYREKWLYAPRPDFISARLTFDLYPNERQAISSVEAKIKNTFVNPIEEALVNVVSYPSYKLEIEGGYEILRKEKSFLHIRFNKPLEPEEVRKLTYAFTIENKGFENSEEDIEIVKNGSFINSFTLMPSFGYNAGFEVSDRKDRKRSGLGEKVRSLDPSKPISSKYSYIANDALRIDFSAVVSTSSDQTIVTPGYLVKEWQEGGRNHFEYKMDKAILKFFSVLSARYEVVKDKWGGVDLEVFYNKGHEKNIPSMISASKDALDYFSKNFAPYQYRQFRIFEFPRYSIFAQAFPNTIPFSEGFGFITDFSDEKDVDYAYYVTAHELAHQWFAHQLIGGNVPGATMLVESLAQYGALMVMKQKEGQGKIAKYLKYEMDRYLSGRASEVKEELPLAMSENQGYIHYRKASAVFYRLQEEMGEERLNAIISRFIKDHGLDAGKAVLPNAQMLVNEIKNAVPSKVSLIEELFNEIVLYENRVVKAEKTKLPTGEFEVTMDLSLKKIKANPKGEERFVDFKEEIPVGLRDKDGELIYYKRHMLSQGEQTLKIKIKEEPFKAGLDPTNSFIDKSLKDNEVSI